MVVPGPKISATPASAQRRDVVVGDDPADRDEDVVHAALARAARVTRGTSVMCAPDRIDSPTTSTSSWSAAVAIISGVWRRPV